MQQMGVYFVSHDFIKFFDELKCFFGSLQGFLYITCHMQTAKFTLDFGCLLFPCLITVARTSNITLTRSGERGHVLVFFPILEERL